MRTLYRVAADRSTGSELTAHAGARRPTRGWDVGLRRVIPAAAGCARLSARGWASRGL